MEHIGVRSVPVITLSSLAIGMIFSLQIVDLLGIFNAEVIAGSAVAWTLSRELAPVITTLMLIGKNGSAMAAELGSMRVTEQIDAMETMSVNPIHFLVVPRVIASAVMFPALTALANVVGWPGRMPSPSGASMWTRPSISARCFVTSIRATYCPESLKPGSWDSWSR
jgi:phospholipid/cholesterol/gamma-HCH transport system permease protein